MQIHVSSFNTSISILSFSALICANPHPSLTTLPDLDTKISHQNQNLSNASSTAQVTCLLTGLPSSFQEHRRIAIYKGLTFVTVCLVLSSSLMGTSILSSDFWIHRNEIAPEVQVLNGPTNFTTNGFSTTTLPIFPNKPKCTPSQPIDPLLDSTIMNDGT